MDNPHLTVIVTAHDETIVSGPTMRSVEEAADHAEAAGFGVERILALDSITPACRRFFGQSRFDHWNRIELTMRDLGRTRNDIVPRTKGQYIAFLDADDLFSLNWLTEGIKCLVEADREGKKVIAHPELNWRFDGDRSVISTTAQDDLVFCPHFFYFSNYYDSLCMTPREAHLSIPYVHRDIPNGLSFQDWQFSIETIMQGWNHVSVRDTIIFKRRRDVSLVTESRSRKALVRMLEPMAIDEVRQLGRP